MTFASKYEQKIHFSAAYPSCLESNNFETIGICVHPDDYLVSWEIKKREAKDQLTDCSFLVIEKW